MKILVKNRNCFQKMKNAFKNRRFARILKSLSFHQNHTQNWDFLSKNRKFVTFFNFKKIFVQRCTIGIKIKLKLAKINTDFGSKHKMSVFGQKIRQKNWIFSHNDDLEAG